MQLQVVGPRLLAGRKPYALRTIYVYLRPSDVQRQVQVRDRYIYIYIWHHPNVGDYTSPMECLGYVSCECLFKHCKGLHAMIMNGGWGCPQHSMGLELRGMFPLNEDDPWGSTVPMHSSLAGSVMILALPEFLLSTLQSWPTHDSPTPFT